MTLTDCWQIAPTDDTDVDDNDDDDDEIKYEYKYSHLGDAARVVSRNIFVERVITRP